MWDHGCLDASRAQVEEPVCFDKRLNVETTRQVTLVMLKCNQRVRNRAANALDSKTSHTIRSEQILYTSRIPVTEPFNILHNLDWLARQTEKTIKRPLFSFGCDSTFGQKLCVFGCIDIHIPNMADLTVFIFKGWKHLHVFCTQLCVFVFFEFAVGVSKNRTITVDK